MPKTTIEHMMVGVATSDVTLQGEVAMPGEPAGLVIFAHGSGSSRLSPRNQMVAGMLNENGLATLLFDLLTPVESAMDEHTRRLRFDIDLLATRLASSIDWARGAPETRELRVGLFGASTGAAAALVAAANRPGDVAAVVSRGGRPDLAGPYLTKVQAPTLLIVGSDDLLVLDLNRQATRALRVDNEVAVVPGATHLFEEPGTLEAVAHLASEWFNLYLSGSGRR